MFSSGRPQPLRVALPHRQSPSARGRQRYAAWSHGEVGSASTGHARAVASMTTCSISMTSLHPVMRRVPSRTPAPLLRTTRGTMAIHPASVLEGGPAGLTMLLSATHGRARSGAADVAAAAQPSDVGGDRDLWRPRGQHALPPRPDDPATVGVSGQEVREGDVFVLGTARSTASRTVPGSREPSVSARRLRPRS